MHVKCNQVTVVLAVNLQFLLSGYGIGFSALGAQVEAEGELSPRELAWFPGSLVLGQVLGSMLAPALADTLGRRPTCLLAALLSAAAWTLLSFARPGWLLLLARALTGLADCGAGPAGIMYISEVAETRLRGSFLNTMTVASGLGIALAYLAGGALSWRAACLPAPALSALAILLLLRAEESPVALLADPARARAALTSYRGSGPEASAAVEEELAALQSSAAGGRLGLAEAVARLWGGSHRRPFLILLALFGLYPLTGMYSIAFFAIDLFKKLGIGNASAVAVSSALSRVLGTALSSALLPRLGRRTLYLPSAALTSLSIGLAGGIVMAGLEGTAVSWALVFLILIFMFAVGLAVCTFPWVLMAEWFPPGLKPLVTGTLVTVQFGFIFLAVQLTELLLAVLGPAGLLLAFSAVCAANTVLVAALVPETHGLTYTDAAEASGQRGPAALAEAGRPLIPKDTGQSDNRGAVG